MKIHKYYAGCHEKHQLNQGMVYHMKQASPYSQAALFPDKPLHTYADKYKPDLGDRGTGKRPFQVYGK